MQRKTRQPNQAPQLHLDRIIGASKPDFACLAYSPGTPAFVAYSAGCTVVCYDPKTHRQHFLLNPSGHACTALAFSPDGKQLAAGEESEAGVVSISVWDMEAPKAAPKLLRSHKYGIRALSFSPDGSQLASIGVRYDSCVCLWDVESSKPLAKHAVQAELLSVAFTSDSRHVITVGVEHFSCWDVVQTSRPGRVTLERRTPKLGKHSHSTFVDVKAGVGRHGVGSQGVYALTSDGLVLHMRDTLLAFDKEVDVKATGAFVLAVSPTLVAAGCSDGNVRVFSAKTLALRGSLPKPAALRQLGVTGDAADALGRPNTPSDPRTVGGLFPDVRALSISASESTVAALHSDHSLFVWDTRNLNKVGRLCSMIAQQGCIWAAAAAPSSADAGLDAAHSDRGGLFATASHDGTVCLWSIAQGRQAGPDGSEFGRDLVGLLRLADDDACDPPDGGHQIKASPERPLPQPALPAAPPAASSAKAYPRALAFSSDGAHLAVGDNEGVVHVFDVASQAPLVARQAHDGPVLALCYTPIGSAGAHLLASAGMDGLIHVYDATEGEYGILQTLHEHSAAVTAVAFADCGQRVVSCSQDRSIIFRHVVNGAYVPYAREMVAKGALYDVVLAREGGQPVALTVGQDRQLRIWELAGGQPVRSVPLQGRADAVKIGALPGDVVVCCHQDGSVRVVDWQRGCVVAEGHGHGDVVTCSFLHAASGRLVTVGGDSCIMLWSLPAQLAQTAAAPVVHVGVGEAERADVPVLQQQISSPLMQRPVELISSPSKQHSERYGRRRKHTLDANDSRGDASSESSLDTTPVKAARLGLAVVASHKLPGWARGEQHRGQVGAPTAELDCDAAWLVQARRPGGKRGWVLSDGDAELQPGDSDAEEVKTADMDDGGNAFELDQISDLTPLSTPRADEEYNSHQDSAPLFGADHFAAGNDTTLMPDVDALVAAVEDEPEPGGHVDDESLVPSPRAQESSSVSVGGDATPEVASAEAESPVQSSVGACTPEAPPQRHVPPTPLTHRSIARQYFSQLDGEGGPPPAQPPAPEAPAKAPSYSSLFRLKQQTLASRQAAPGPGDEDGVSAVPSGRDRGLQVWANVQLPALDALQNELQAMTVRNADRRSNTNSAPLPASRASSITEGQLSDAATLVLECLEPTAAAPRALDRPDLSVPLPPPAAREPVLLKGLELSVKTTMERAPSAGSTAPPPQPGEPGDSAPLRERSGAEGKPTPETSSISSLTWPGDFNLQTPGTTAAGGHAPEAGLEAGGLAPKSPPQACMTVNPQFDATPPASPELLLGGPARSGWQGNVVFNDTFAAHLDSGVASAHGSVHKAPWFMDSTVLYASVSRTATRAADAPSTPGDAAPQDLETLETPETAAADVDDVALDLDPLGDVPALDGVPVEAADVPRPEAAWHGRPATTRRRLDVELEAAGGERLSNGSEHGVEAPPEDHVADGAEGVESEGGDATDGGAEASEVGGDEEAAERPGDDGRCVDASVASLVAMVPGHATLHVRYDDSESGATAAEEEQRPTSANQPPEGARDAPASPHAEGVGAVDAQREPDGTAAAQASSFRDERTDSDAARCATEQEGDQSDLQQPLQTGRAAVGGALPAHNTSPIMGVTTREERPPEDQGSAEAASAGSDALPALPPFIRAVPAHPAASPDSQSGRARAAEGGAAAAASPSSNLPSKLSKIRAYLAGKSPPNAERRDAPGTLLAAHSARLSKLRALSSRVATWTSAKDARANIEGLVDTWKSRSTLSQSVSDIPTRLPPSHRAAASPAKRATVPRGAAAQRASVRAERVDAPAAVPRTTVSAPGALLLPAETPAASDGDRQPLSAAAPTEERKCASAASSPASGPSDATAAAPPPQSPATPPKDSPQPSAPPGEEPPPPSNDASAPRADADDVQQQQHQQQHPRPLVELQRRLASDEARSAVGSLDDSLARLVRVTAPEAAAVASEDAPLLAEALEVAAAQLRDMAARLRVPPHGDHAASQAALGLDDSSSRDRQPPGPSDADSPRHPSPESAAGRGSLESSIPTALSDAAAESFIAKYNELLLSKLTSTIEESVGEIIRRRLLDATAS